VGVILIAVRSPGFTRAPAAAADGDVCTARRVIRGAGTRTAARNRYAAQPLSRSPIASAKPAEIRAVEEVNDAGLSDLHDELRRRRPGGVDDDGHVGAEVAVDVVEELPIRGGKVVRRLSREARLALKSE